MGKLGKCPLMAALVMLVSFGNPVDVPNGQAGKKTGKDEMLQAGYFVRPSSYIRRAVEAGRIRFISVQLTGHLQTGPLAIYPSRQPRPKLSHQPVNFVQGYCTSVVHSNSVKCTKFAAREYSALIPAGGPPLPTLCWGPPCPGCPHTPSTLTIGPR